jgi:hypothetical protein
MQAPQTGKARLVLINGQMSQWVDVEEIEITPYWVYCQSGRKGVTGVQFPLVSLAHIEYATADEVAKLKEQAAKEKP